MCLAIPGKILSIADNPLRTARVDFGGLVKEVFLVYVPEADIGDYVLTHVGFAISRLDEKEAEKTLGYLQTVMEEDAKDEISG